MVVTVGETLLEVPVTVPMLWLMLREVALLTDQESVLDWPAVMVEGETEKEEMVGA